MAPTPTTTEIRLNNITICLTMAANTYGMLADSFKTPFSDAICNTIQSVVKYIQIGILDCETNKDDCTSLLEQAHELLNAIIIVHVKSDTGVELPPSVLKQLMMFTETLHKIHTFVEAQQKGSKIKAFFRQGGMSNLLRECRAGLQQGLDFFQVETVSVTNTILEMQEAAEKRHQEVLDMIEALSDTTSSDVASSISRVWSGSHNSSNSISMLPSEPKIFHGRESELADILQLFSQGTPRVAILGAGGMGKTSLAQAVIHHTEITGRYNQQRFFIACESASTQVELAALIGAHIGLKPVTDFTRPVIQYFSSSPHSLLILDNLETLWETNDSRGNIEEFLSLLTGVDHLALVITMRGAERPAKVAWTRPFLPPLKPLEQDAARQTFIDIADNTHDPEEVDRVLSLTDNLPLAINLVAHLVDTESCSNVLSRWEHERTSLISVGYDRRSNLDLSISLSLSSPRLNSFPHSKDLLSLLSMLPDGLSEAELVQSQLPIDNILGCKAALIRTTLAYSDEQKRLKVLVPIREYMHKIQPPGDEFVRPLLKHFRDLLEFFMEYHGTQSSSGTIARISSNYWNIQNIVQNGLQPGHPDLVDSIYCTCDLNHCSRLIGRGPSPLIGKIHDILPYPRDHHLEAYFFTELFNSGDRHSISNLETLVSEALECFKHFDDPDLKCRFYRSLVNYYRIKHDISTAQKFCETAISVALSSGNTKMHSKGLYGLAWMKWYLGDYFVAQLHAYRAQNLARICADLYTEAQALNIEATCWTTLGNYKKSILLSKRARDLLNLCGMSGGDLDHGIMSTQAEIHKLKSEYVDAHSINTQILREISVDQDSYNHGLSFLNIAEIGVSMGIPKDDVQRSHAMAREIFTTRGYSVGVMMCETILADLHLREGNMLAAKTLFERCVQLTLKHAQITSYCLERLGDVSRWNTPNSMSHWTIVFLVHSTKQKEKLGVHKALQFLGDVFLAEDDEHTAISLFTVALEGFVYMDIHHSKAECMLRLGDLYKGHGNLLKAVELWEAAKPLFELSSQAKQVEHVDERLAIVGEDVQEQHRANLARLAEIHVPSATVEDLDNLSDIEDLEGLKLTGEKALDVGSVCIS
ncbi:hypothetical protein B0H13DRAFT_1894777 [Mycena leptocephala]|nr:hypothetical protein B0H13DRAFT_1894777 [Mycena leptocephala]